LLCCVSAAIVLQMRYVLHFSIEWRVVSYSFMMCTGIYVGCGGLDDVCIMANDVWSLCLVHPLP
jgi:hypothetical protein